MTILPIICFFYFKKKSSCVWSYYVLNLNLGWILRLKIHYQITKGKHNWILKRRGTKMRQTWRVWVFIHAGEEEEPSSWPWLIASFEQQSRCTRWFCSSQHNKPRKYKTFRKTRRNTVYKTVVSVEDISSPNYF